MGKKNISLKKYVFCIFTMFTVILTSSNILAGTYIYDAATKKEDKKEEKKEEESSVSTVATPEFSFQSAAQILMEPTTGKILYANNEDEKLLPASVTKVMTY